MNPERLRCIVIGGIAVTMLVMAIGFVVYLAEGYLSNDPAVMRLLVALVSGGAFVLYLIWEIWITRRRFGVRGKVIFMQGYRRKRNDEE
jgi:hypothetical protein